MKVVVIYEENHGFIGLAKDMKSAFQFLIDDKWITENTELFEPTEGEEYGWFPISRAMTDLRRSLFDTLMFLWNCDKEYFDGSFYFWEEEIHGENI